MASATTAPPTVWTVRALHTWTTKHFQDKKLESAAVESRILLGHVLGCRPIEVLARYDEEPTEQERQSFREIIRRRLEGCPVAYLVGSKDFYLLNFEVSPAVLIPRPDTETLVQAAIELLKGKPNPTILDLGTGSGCIAISLAHALKTARVTATDLSPDALDQAKANARKHGVLDRMEFKNGDLFAAVPGDMKYDLIASNPPYIPPSEIETLDVGVRDFEPRLALDGGPDGLAFYRRIASEAPERLNTGGWLVLEMGWTQDAAVRGLLEAQPALALGDTRKDLGGRLRVAVAKKR